MGNGATTLGGYDHFAWSAKRLLVLFLEPILFFVLNVVKSVVHIALKVLETYPEIGEASS